MKLLYELPEAEKEIFEGARSKKEKLMYCTPFNIDGKHFVSDGYMIFTDAYIYKLLGGELIEKYDLSKMSDFSTEILYGSCGFYAKTTGTNRSSFSRRKQHCTMPT